MVCVGIVVDESLGNSGLLRTFSGGAAYHAFFVCTETQRMYDMHLIRRRRRWPYYTRRATTKVHLFPVPQVSRAYLEARLDDGTDTYGFVDYALFGLRRIYHALGKHTPNARGLICSEQVNNDLRACGVDTPWSERDAPPSPWSLLQWLLGLECPAKGG